MWFLTRLSEFRVVARKMVLSQGLAGGDPVQEIAMTEMLANRFPALTSSRNDDFEPFSLSPASI